MTMCVLCMQYNRCHGKAVKRFFGLMVRITNRKTTASYVLLAIVIARSFDSARSYWRLLLSYVKVDYF
jgi:hypothetical protein